MPIASRSHKEEIRNNPNGERPSFTFQGQTIQKHPELVNLAKYLPEQKLKDIAEEVIEDYKEDDNSRQEWLEMQSEWIRLYYQKDYPKNNKMTWTSKESMPILTEGCQQFHARAYQAFFSNRKFVSAMPIGKVSDGDRERAQRVGDYMSWQLEVQDRSYKRNKDRLLRALPLHGSVFTKTYRDPIRRRNVVENVRAVDLVVPYSAVGVDVEDLERKTHQIWMQPHKGATLFRKGWFVEQPKPWAMGTSNPVYETVDMVTGMHNPTRQEYKSALVLEQHRFLDLDEDDLGEPFIVWVDRESGRVLRLAIRYATNRVGIPTSHKEPLEFFTHYAYIENPDGFYGLGLGHLTGGLNKSVNKILRQTLDAATIQNLRPGFADKKLNIKRGENLFNIGEIKTIDGMSDDLRKSLVFFEHPGPSQALVQLMTTLMERADRLNMVTDMLTGQPDKVYQPTTALAQIEQGLMTFSAVQTRVYAALEQELAKLYRNNGIYLDEVEYFTLQDAMGPQASQQQMVYRQDFVDNLQVRPIFDPRHVTEETKERKAGMEYQFALNNPIVANSPPHLQAASRRYLETIGSININEILPPVEQLIQEKQQAQQMQQQQIQAAQAMEQQKIGLDAQDTQIQAYEAQTNRFEAQTDRMEAEGDITTKARTAEVKNDVALQKADIDRIRALADLEAEVYKNRIGEGIG